MKKSFIISGPDSTKMEVSAFAILMCRTNINEVTLEMSQEGHNKNTPI